MLPGRQSRWLVSVCLQIANMIAIRLSIMIPYRDSGAPAAGSGASGVFGVLDDIVIQD